MKIDLTRFAGRFRQETRDNLALLDAAVGQLDSAIRQGESPDEALREMMRLAHAIKGAARMLGFAHINKLCHALEEMLIACRSTGVVSVGQTDLIVDARKGIERLLAFDVQPSGEESPEPQWMTRLLEELQTGASGASTEVKRTDPPIPAPPQEPSAESNPPPASPLESFRQSTVRVNVDTIDDLLYYGRELTQALEGLHKAQLGVERIRQDMETAAARAGRSGEGVSAVEVEEFSRRLLGMSLGLRERIAEVDRNVRQIDSGAVELRMRPIAELFETIPLQVRELGKTLGKEVDVDFAGEGVRLDGRIVELLREPLLHLIRNALDHGVESPEIREQAGKTPEGRLTIGAYENAGWARVVIADDGKGIDLTEVWARAAELGLTDNPVPNDSDLKKGYRFLFDDHFTSRRGASDISGRGVGLAAVKRRLQELRGDVTVESSPGLGSRFTLSMPSSLSSQRILVTTLRIGGEVLFIAFPTAMVRGTMNRSINSGGRNAAAIELGDYSRALSLSALLDGRTEDPAERELYLVFCTDGLKVGVFAVDQIIAETEVVIEPLPHVARSSEIIAGAAPLTSDDIIFVLNVPTLLNLAALKRARERVDV